MNLPWPRMGIMFHAVVSTAFKQNTHFFSPRKRKHPFKNTHRLTFCSSSQSPEDLSGLGDSDFCINGGNGSLEVPVEMISRPAHEEFSFLFQSIYDYDADFMKNEAKLHPGKFSDEALLLCELIRTNGTNWGDEMPKSLRPFREKLKHSLVIDVLKLLKCPELCVKFFIWAGRQIGYQHVGATYDALLEVLAVDRRVQIPVEFLSEIKEEDGEMLGRLLNVLIRKCSKGGFWKEAIEELGRLKDCGNRPSRTTYYALIQVLLLANQLELASQVYTEMGNAGLNLDGFTLGCFARTLCKAGKWREALNIIDKEDFVPDTVLYNKMISGLCEASLLEEAISFLHRMRSNSCFPNVVTYRNLLMSFLKAGQLNRCRRILNQMTSEGLHPSPSIFNSLVHAYCKSREFAYAYKLVKKMRVCGCRPGYVIYNILIGGIFGREDPPTIEAMELAERVYEEMLDAGCVLNKVNVVGFTRCLCARGKFEKAIVVIRDLMTKGFIPDSSTYTKVVELLCQADKVDKALLLFEEMKKNNIVPNVFTYTILIDSFCKVGLIQQGRNWFDEMTRDGCLPNVVTYTTLIHAYLKTRRLIEANDLFERMLSMGCAPNIVTYTALIDGLCKAGEVDKACRVYERMRGSGIKVDVDVYFGSEAGMEPNVFTYGALVDGLCKAHKVSEAHELLEAMGKDGCLANNVVYDALIDGFCKVGKLDEAQKVFAKMVECGYSPNVYTYSSLIDRLFKDKRLDLAIKVLSKMLENSCSPNVVTYTEMIDGLCKVGKTDEASRLLVMMEEKGCHPNVVTYTAMIDGYGKVGKVDLGLKLLREMAEKGCAPNIVTYRVLINHCCAAGLLDEACGLLDEMKQTYWPPHALWFKDVIQGFSIEFINSLGLLHEISEYNMFPMVPAYSILIDSLCKAGRLEVALELHKEMVSVSTVQPCFAQKTAYSSLIEGLSLAGKIEKAFELYADMTRMGHIPELSIFFCLIKGLCKINRRDEALQLLDSTCWMIPLTGLGHPISRWMYLGGQDTLTGLGHPILGGCTWADAQEGTPSWPAG
ncbi:hypothetical protein AMTR_s00066p00041260 [Amborella trichopoda]|uniref:Pentacotripeptide-repeat region of PRORP domain-containing protein n=1 Tax=Amborella trichopoda TaxID=13333 RepID=U5DF81_AMBTC|nr:hypothetical protein AMTR_s00066p00041260 [Amborella trichopoda]